MQNNIIKGIVNITADLLEHFIIAAENILTASVSRKKAYQMFNSRYGDISRSSSSKFFNNLKRQGYLKYEKSTDSFVFTTKTKIKLAKVIGKNIGLSKKFCFFSFDIPEQLKFNRDKFRKSIKDLGCKQIQKSLWVTNKNIYDLVQEIAEELGIEKYIICIISEKTDIDQTIRRIINT